MCGDCFWVPEGLEQEPVLKPIVDYYQCLTAMNAAKNRKEPNTIKQMDFADPM